jgi:hypothetical protein
LKLSARHRCVAGAVAAAGLAAATAPPAGAQSPTVNGYSPPAPNVQAKVDTPAKDSGALPFTGIDVGLVAGAGLALGAAGGALRRMTRARQSS